VRISGSTTKQPQSPLSPPPGRPQTAAEAPMRELVRQMSLEFLYQKLSCNLNLSSKRSPPKCWILRMERRARASEHIPIAVVAGYLDRWPLHD